LNSGRKGVVPELQTLHRYREIMTSVWTSCILKEVDVFKRDTPMLRFHGLGIADTECTGVWCQNKSNP